MRKLVLLGFLVCVLIFTFKAQSIKAKPGDIWVPYDWPTIQEAINVADPGDTIHVMGGPYYEHVVVNKSLSLITESEAVIDGSGTGTVVNITASFVNITGFTIQNGGSNWTQRDSGVNLIGRSYCFIENNHINGSRIGIYVQGSSNIRIIGNSITHSTDSVLLTLSSNNYIEANNIANHSHGVFLDAGSNLNLIAHNVIANGSGGLHLQYWSSNNTVYNNRVAENDYGIGLSQSQNNTIYHNSFIDNTDQAWAASESYNNKWDAGWPTGGNYWSDHVGDDEKNGEYQDQPGSDGISDAIYNVHDSNIDKYPLMGPANVFDVRLDMIEDRITVISNSTVSAFQMNTAQKIISFNVTGNNGKGFCRVDIPNHIVSGLWEYNYTVLVDDQAPLYIRNWTESSQTYIYFTYQHSEHEVIIIPEFPSLLILSLFMIATLLAIIAYRKKHHMCQL